MKLENVRVKRGNCYFVLKVLGIRDGIMKIESTEKTRGMGIPEYLQLVYDGSCLQCYKGNGWKAEVLKNLL